jgi:hypothetical protein
MNKKFIYLTSILALAMAASIAVTAQESYTTANNFSLNNTTQNDTILDNATVGVVNTAAQNSAPSNRSQDAVLNISAASHTAQNLSTVNGQQIVVAPISELASVAPMVAASASSAQVAGEPEGSFKIGTGAGGSDPFNPGHVEIDALKLGIPIKSMRDTGKMFFVCDIV